MQVSVEDLGGLERRMTVQVPAEQIEREVQDRLKSLSRKAKLDGFRPGKVPVKVIKRMYGPQVHQEVVNDVLQSSFQDALVQEKLRLVGGPTIEPKSLGEGKDLEYSATFEVFPEFEVTGIEELKVERPVAEVTEADVDAMLENLRKQRTECNPVERAAQEGDRVNITFEGKPNGEDFPGNKGEDLPVVLGAGMMIREFEKKLTGLKADDDTEFDVTFPEDYHAKELAGKTVHFAVKVNAVAEPRLPEIDDEFARAFGIEEGGVEGLRKAVKENMERELDEKIKTILKNQVMDKLLEANDIPVPQAMVDEEIERLAQQANFPLDTEEGKQSAKARFEGEARRRIALGLLISRLVSANAIKPDSGRVRAKLESIASSYEDPQSLIQWYSQNPQALENIGALVLEDQVVDWLLERAQVIDKPSSFEAIIKPGQA
jgi:trigger factor